MVDVITTYLSIHEKVCHQIYLQQICHCSINKTAIIQCKKVHFHGVFFKPKTPIIRNISNKAGKALQLPNIHQYRSQSQTSNAK